MTNRKSGIECIEISKSFGEHRGLKTVSLTVLSGAITVLVGPNGSGKTTLLKILSTLYPPTSGRAFVSGRDTEKEASAVKRITGFVPSEERSFYWRLTGRQNLRFFGALYGLTGERADERVEEILVDFGLKEKGDVRFSNYSTGMKQALGIARALLHDPQVLLLDEPFRSLDRNMEKRIIDLLRQRAREKGTSILMATHDLSGAEALADRVALIEEGQIRAEGTPGRLAEAGGLPPSSSLAAIVARYSGRDER